MTKTMGHNLFRLQTPLWKCQLLVFTCFFFTLEKRKAISMNSKDHRKSEYCIVRCANTIRNINPEILNMNPVLKTLWGTLQHPWKAFMGPKGAMSTYLKITWLDNTSLYLMCWVVRYLEYYDTFPSWIRMKGQNSYTIWDGRKNLNISGSVQPEVRQYQSIPRVGLNTACRLDPAYGCPCSAPHGAEPYSLLSGKPTPQSRPCLLAQTPTSACSFGEAVPKCCPPSLTSSRNRPAEASFLPTHPAMQQGQ